MFRLYSRGKRGGDIDDNAAMLYHMIQKLRLMGVNRSLEHKRVPIGVSRHNSDAIFADHVPSSCEDYLYLYLSIHDDTQIYRPVTKHDSP